MLRSLYSAASGMLAQQVNIDTISHNLANVNTTGFKKGRAEFQDLFYAHVRPPVSGDTGIMVGQGSRPSAVHRIFSNGTLQSTGNALDMAIQGPGFFRIRRPTGSEAYTRDGAFHLDGARQLVTANGDLVLGKDGPITIPVEATNPEVTADGTIRYADAETGTTIIAGQITLATFPNPSGLVAQGNNLWTANDKSGQPLVATAGGEQTGRIAQMYLEASNVQAVEEMVSLIVAQRAYEINSKAVQSADDMMALANQLRR